jgi:cation transport protein ChaC
MPPADDAKALPELCAELIEAAFPYTVADDAHAMPLASDEEVLASLDDTLRQGDGSGDLWVFGYGSLMWRPELKFAEQRLGHLQGWQRSFCLWQWRYRGSREKPGLMLALDQGGACTGVLYRLKGSDLREQLVPLWQREMTGRGYVPYWVEVDAEAGPVTAITFLANTAGERYAGRLSVEVVADRIATACGNAGPNAAYLLATWRYCRTAGIEDIYIETLQRLVAERLAVHGRGTGTRD